MDKRTLAQLIDAYADAKASRNQHLVNSMVAQLEQALDAVFPEAEAPAVEPEVMGSEF
jgi:DNA-binding transcriptional regulator YbjK